MRQNGRHKAKDPTSSMDDGDDLARLMRPFYEYLCEFAFQDAGDEFGLDVLFQLENPYVQTVLDQLAKDVRRVTETTKDEIRALVGKQAQEGWSNELLADMIREHGITASESRAMTIARTETAIGYSQGSIAAYRASGVVSQVEWLAGGPDNCDICRELSGRRVELGGEFAEGVTAPPIHPNCTCVISPIVSED